jgi:hypothetical protein
VTTCGNYANGQPKIPDSATRNRRREASASAAKVDVRDFTDERKRSRHIVIA